MSFLMPVLSEMNMMGIQFQRSLEQAQRLTGKSIKRLAGNRGYRGNKEINGTQILILDTPKQKKHTTNAKRNISCFANVQE